MNFFDTSTKNESSKSHSLWAEKYRPNSMDEYICDDNLRNIINNFIERKDIPQLLFYGDAGSGKTTLAKIITNNIPCDVMYVNASDHTGVDFIRDRVKPFAASTGFQDLKIVILDEMDFISPSSQAALRNLMETYSENTRFILTCNFIEKVISPLISRCQQLRIHPPNKKDVAMYVQNVLVSENIRHQLDDIKYIVNSYYPDIRKIVNYSQQISTSGKIKHIKNQSASFDLKNKVLDLLSKSESNSNCFNEIREIINDSGIKQFEELYHELYEKVHIYAKNNTIEAILIVAEYSYQNSLVVDKEITFMACIARILKI
jgi:DNA polymerase III delta prime subunit